MSRLSLAIDEFISDEKILKDVDEFLSPYYGSPMELGESPGECVVEFDKDTVIYIVTKQYYGIRCNYDFGEHVRVGIAIGGLSSIKHGVPIAKICFMIIHYDMNCNLIKFDILDRFY
jgi:hypothetical protein